MAKRDYVKITFYLLPAEHEGIMAAAKYLYEQGALPRLTAGTYARAASLLMFKQLSAMLAEAHQKLSSA